MRRGIGVVVLFICGLVAVGLALHGYFTPLSGITGTPGPLLVVLGGAVLALAAVLLWWMTPGALRMLLSALTVLTIVAVIAAGYFLLSTGISVAGIGAAIGFLIIMLDRPTRRTPA